MTYLTCILDNTKSGEPMACKTLKKINSKLSLMYRKKEFLTPLLQRRLYNSQIQPHFKYACSARYLELTKVIAIYSK